MRAVREMAARGQIEPHESVARLQQGKEHFRVCRSTRVRLHVRKLAAEQFRHALDRNALDDIDVLTSAVIAFAGKSLGIFVGQDGALRLKHRARDDILGRDQLDFIALAAELELDGVVDFGIQIAQCGRKEGLNFACTFLI